MDDVVFEEFKGTGNMELVLSRRLQEKRIFPAIDISKSGTRREDLLLSQKELEVASILRRSSLKSEQSIEQFIHLFKRTRYNEDLINHILTKYVKEKSE